MRVRVVGELGQPEIRNLNAYDIDTTPSDGEEAAIYQPTFNMYVL